MVRNTLITIAALVLAVLTTAATPAVAQGPSTALLYNDNTPELQGSFTALFDELSLQGTAVSVTADATQFASDLSAGSYGAYGAFSADSNLLATWKAMVPDNAFYVSATLAVDGEIDTEFYSFQAAPGALGVVGRTNTYVTQPNAAPKLIDQRSYDSRTNNTRQTADPAATESMATASGGLVLAGDGAAAMAAPAVAGIWPWDGLVEAISDFFTDLFDDILEWIECVGSCALDCVDTFLDNIPEGVEIEVTVEAQTTPPGVKTSITIKASGQDAVKVMREYAKMMACIGTCIANC